ncbi:FecR domain-containing protein [Phenylobacterium sp.]|uniref:FecR family protein n=1 Tax=Phenylobacterium sp. TaxID=1871053 RepID=UPI00286A8ECA|nr:FecR domain-containing protein [Phenylobacterium sp.]
MVREALTLEALRALSADDAAATFLARRAEGLTAGETRLLADWLAADADHRAAFARAERGWQAFEGAETDEILAAMRAHALAPRRRAGAGWRPMAAAAALVLAIGAAGLLSVPDLNPWRSPPGVEVAAYTAAYTSARGEVREVPLPDGSTLTLDADSAVQVRFEADGRAVQLGRGRARFAVAPQPARPFSVTAGDHRVVAVGTRFDVNLAAGTLTVTLLEGRLSIAGPGGVSALQAGQQYVSRAGKSVVSGFVAAEGQAGAWRRGLLTFDDAPLTEAVAEVNRYSQNQIVARDPAVTGLRVSGQFRAGEAGRFAETLAELHGLQVVRRPGELEIAPRR